jgi:DNA recombination protein RmuC
MEVIGFIAVFILGLLIGFILRSLTNQSISAQFGAVQQQLSRLDTETKRLNDMLNNDMLRGKWGETVAHSVLIKVGFIEGVHYVQQGTIVTSADKTFRPDFTFLLPNDQKIHMDCKFPFANYKAFLMADGPTKREEIVKVFEKDVKTLIDETAKYIGEDTLNCVLMFIPNESVFHFVSESEAIQERAYKQRVILCSPQSLILMLELLQRAQQVINLERSSVQARSELLELIRLTEGFGEDITMAKNRIAAAKTALNQLETTQVARLNKSARSLMALLDSKAMLEPPAVANQHLIPLSDE